MKNEEFWKRRFGTYQGVKNWHFYSYEYIDELSFMPLARELLKDWSEAEAILDAVEVKFRSMGWDGDGDMQVMWLPPFVGAGPDNNFGCYSLHVKQFNDGISWIASPYAFPFHRLFEPTDAQYLPAGASSLESMNWRRGAVEWQAKFIGNLDSRFDDENS